MITALGDTTETLSKTGPQMDSKRFFTRLKPRKHLFPTEVLPDSDQSSQETDQEMEDAGKQSKYRCDILKVLTSNGDVTNLQIQQKAYKYMMHPQRG